MAATYGLSQVSAGDGKEQQNQAMMSSLVHDAPSKKRSRAYFDYEADTPSSFLSDKSANRQTPVKRLQPSLASTSSQKTDPKSNDNSAAVILGVSWQILPSHDDPEDARDPIFASAVRGWERFIENHYSCLNQAKIFLEHKGHNIYIVLGSRPGTRLKVRDSNLENTLMFEGGNDYSHFPEPTKGAGFNPADECDAQFYLFTSDLLQARLIADDWETCVKKVWSGEFASNAKPIVASRGPSLATQPASQIDVSAIQSNGHSSKPTMTANPNTVSEHGGMDIDN